MEAFFLSFPLSMFGETFTFFSFSKHHLSLYPFQCTFLACNPFLRIFPSPFPPQHVRHLRLKNCCLFSSLSQLISFCTSKPLVFRSLPPLCKVVVVPAVICVAILAVFKNSYLHIITSSLCRGRLQVCGDKSLFIS